MKKITLGFMFAFTLAFVAGSVSISPTQVQAQDLSCTIETPDGRILEGTWINGVCQPNGAVAVSTDLSIDAQPISFFDRLTLAFTFNAEKKAQMLQDFSSRSFALAQKKIAEGKSAEASVFFKKSENYTLKAGAAASKIKNEEKRNAAQNSISVTASNRTTALTTAKANVENPTAKEAIQNAIDRQVEVDASVKAGVSLAVPGLSGNTGSNVCDKNSTPSITILTPDGGEIYHLGDSVTFTWKTCNIASNVHLTGELVSVSDSDEDRALFGEGGENIQIEAASLNDGAQAINFGLNSQGHQTINQGTYKFKLSVFGNSSVTDTSNSSFVVN